MADESTITDTLTGLGKGAWSVIQRLAPYLEAGAIGAAEAGGRQPVDTTAFWDAHRRKDRIKQLKAVGRTFGVPQDKLDALPEDTPLEAVIPQYTISGGALWEIPPPIEGAEPRMVRAAPVKPTKMRSASGQDYFAVEEPGVGQGTVLAPGVTAPPRFRAVVPEGAPAGLKPPTDQIGRVAYALARQAKGGAEPTADEVQAQTLAAVQYLNQQKEQLKLTTPDKQVPFTGPFLVDPKTGVVTRPDVPPAPPAPTPTPGKSWGEWLGLTGPPGAAAAAPQATPTPGRPAAKAKGKPLTKALARKFLQQSGGDKDRARALATASGYVF